MTKEQLGQLIIASEDSMYHVAKSVLYNDADCADAIQEAIVRAFSKIHTLKQDEFAKTWLIRILLNECYAIMRREKKIVSLESFKNNEQTVEHTDYTDLYNAVAKLPQSLKIVVTLYYVEGFSVKEIAAVEESTESAIKNRLYKARNLLRDDLTGVQKGAMV